MDGRFDSDDPLELHWKSWIVCENRIVEGRGAEPYDRFLSFKRDWRKWVARLDDFFKPGSCGRLQDPGDEQEQRCLHRYE